MVMIDEEPGETSGANANEGKSKKNWKLDFTSWLIAFDRQVDQIASISHIALMFSQVRFSGNHVGSDDVPADADL